MTQKDARIELRALGFVIHKTFAGDYRVNFINGAEETAYYTDDLCDAVTTARFMLDHRRAMNSLAGRCPDCGDVIIERAGLSYCDTCDHEVLSSNE